METRRSEVQMSKTLLMVPLAVVSIAVALLISSVACADEPCGNQKGQFADLEKREADLGKIAQLRMSQPVKIEDCSDRSVDLRSAAVGFRCRTSKDAIFERVAKNGFGEAWKGLGFVDKDLRYTSK